MNFVVNIARGMFPPGYVADREARLRKPVPALPPRRTIHLPDCRYAGRSRRSYRLDPVAASRLIDRDRAGNGDGLTRACAVCDASHVIGMIVDAT